MQYCNPNYTKLFWVIYKQISKKNFIDTKIIWKVILYLNVANIESINKISTWKQQYSIAASVLSNYTLSSFCNNIIINCDEGITKCHIFHFMLQRFPWDGNTMRNICIVYQGSISVEKQQQWFVKSEIGDFNLTDKYGLQKRKQKIIC